MIAFLRAAWWGRRVFGWQDWADATDRTVMMQEWHNRKPLRVIAYGTPSHGRTASTILVFGMVRMAGHPIEYRDHQ